MTNLIIFEAQNEHWRTEIATSEQQILLFDLPSIIMATISIHLFLYYNDE